MSTNLITEGYKTNHDIALFLPFKSDKNMKKYFLALRLISQLPTRLRRFRISNSNKIIRQFFVTQIFKPRFVFKYTAPSLKTD